MAGDDRLLRPLGGERRAAREVLERQDVDDGEVVVAGQAHRAVRLGQRDAGVRVGAVADEVAQAPQLLRARLLRRRRSPPRRRGGCRGCRWRSRPAWLATVSIGAQPAASADRDRDRARRGGGRRGRSCGRATAGPEPVPVQARAYFSPAQLERAEDFRTRPAGLGLAARWRSRSALLVLARARARRGGAGRPAAPGRSPARRPRPPVALIAGLAPLPLSRDRPRARRGRRPGRPRAGRLGGRRGQGGGGLGGLRGRRRRAARGRHAAHGAALVDPGRGRRRGLRRGTVYVGPVVLDPLFNKFTPAAGGASCAATCSSSRARRASTSARSTRWTPPAARRRPTPTSAASGTTKRVVLYDTLLKDFTPAEMRLVVAHELGHVRHHDVRDGLLWLAVVAPVRHVGRRARWPSGSPRATRRSGRARCRPWRCRWRCCRRP